MHTVTQNAELMNHEVQRGKGLAHCYTYLAAAPRIIIEFKSTQLVKIANLATNLFSKLAPPLILCFKHIPSN